MPLRNKCSRNIEQRALEMTQQRCVAVIYRIPSGVFSACGLGYALVYPKQR